MFTNKILLVFIILGLIIVNVYAVISYKKLNVEKNELLINLKLFKDKIELYENELDLLNSDFCFIKNIIDSYPYELINIKDINVILFFTKDDCYWCLTPLFLFMEEFYYLSKNKSMSFAGIEIVKNSYNDRYFKNKYSFSFPLLIDKYSFARSHLNKLPTPFIVVTDINLFPIFALCGDHRYNNRIENIEKKLKKIIGRK